MDDHRAILRSKSGFSKQYFPILVNELGTIEEGPRTSYVPQLAGAPQVPRRHPAWKWVGIAAAVMSSWPSSGRH